MHKEQYRHHGNRNNHDRRIPFRQIHRIIRSRQSAANHCAASDRRHRTPQAAGKSRAAAKIHRRYPQSSGQRSDSLIKRPLRTIPAAADDVQNKRSKRTCQPGQIRISFHKIDHDLQQAAGS